MERDRRHRLGKLAGLLVIAIAAGALGAALVMLVLRLLRSRRQAEQWADPAGKVGWQTGDPIVVSTFGPAQPNEERGVPDFPRAGSSREADVPESQRQEESGVHLPAPTYWPAVFGFGLALVMFGLVTNYAFTLVGVLLIIASLVGWIGDLLHG